MNEISIDNSRWSQKEEELFRQWYGRESVHKTATRLNRRIDDVRSHAKELGVRKDSFLWTTEQDNILRELYGKVPLNVLKEKIGRSQNSIMARARTINVMRQHKEWTQQEIETLQKWYPKYGGPAVAKILHRTVTSIRTMTKMLGIKSELKHRWNKKEVELLQKLWNGASNVEIAKILKRNTSSIRHRAQRLNLPSKVIIWTEDENEFLRQHRFTMTNREIGQKIGRTGAAVSTQLQKLGVQRLKVHHWSTREKLIVKLMYPTHSISQIAKRLNLRPKQVDGKIRKLGLRKKGLFPQVSKPLENMEKDAMSQ